ncbi:MAG: hypothetical protein IPI97_10375 [Nitrosomonas sp.]|nr:hypothetical protein [Nitrosomonas sp.]MBK7365369.1 hypothetical protein [Nitrosomonas sp.]
MSHPLSGSEKLKEKCQSMASLTPEEITQVAGGFSFGGFNLSSWWIRGIPADIYKSGLQQLQVNEMNVDQQQF